jgi:hypothetical protein
MTTQKGVTTHELICAAQKSLIKRLSRKIEVASEMPWMKDRFIAKTVTLGQVVATLSKDDFIGYAYEDQSFDSMTMRWHCLHAHGIKSWMI